MTTFQKKVFILCYVPALEELAINLLVRSRLLQNQLALEKRLPL